MTDDPSIIDRHPEDFVWPNTCRPVKIGITSDAYLKANRLDPKMNSGKLKRQLQLLPASAKDQIAAVFEHGAAKYGEWNWRDTKIQITTYIGAIQRHLDAVQEGEDIDPDSGLPHMAHIGASIMIVMDADYHGCLIDDRPTGSKGKTWDWTPLSITPPRDESDFNLTSMFEDVPAACVGEWWIKNLDMIDELKVADVFWYLASPYSSYCLGRPKAAEMVAEGAGTLLNLGVITYCPIAETHQIAAAGHVPQVDHEFWMKRDTPFMNAAHGMIVYTMKGWEVSEGVTEERNRFRAAGKPIVYLSPRVFGFDE